MEKQEVDEHGNTVERSFAPGSRYYYDFECKRGDGWQQFDTDQDAWYFGIWCNPKKLQILTYAEGDEILIKCRNRESYNSELKAMEKFYGSPPPAFIAIDFDKRVRTEYYDERPKPIKVRK